MLHADSNQPNVDCEMLYADSNQPNVDCEMLYANSNQPNVEYEMLHADSNQPNVDCEMLHANSNQPNVDCEMLHADSNQRNVDCEMLHANCNQPNVDCEMLHANSNQPNTDNKTSQIGNTITVTLEKSPIEATYADIDSDTLIEITTNVEILKTYRRSRFKKLVKKYRTGLRKKLQRSTYWGKKNIMKTSANSKIISCSTRNRYTLRNLRPDKRVQYRDAYCSDVSIDSEDEYKINKDDVYSSDSASISDADSIKHIRLAKPRNEINVLEMRIRKEMESR
jgi:hypothetical protein